MKQIVVVLFLALAATVLAAARIEVSALPQSGDADAEVSK